MGILQGDDCYSVSGVDDTQDECNDVMSSLRCFSVQLGVGMRQE